MVSASAISMSRVLEKVTEINNPPPFLLFTATETFKIRLVGEDCLWSSTWVTFLSFLDSFAVHLLIWSQYNRSPLFMHVLALERYFFTKEAPG